MGPRGRNPGALPGSHADEALQAGSPLAKFAPGRFEKMVGFSAAGWESYIQCVNPIPLPSSGEKVQLLTPKLVVNVQGKKIEAKDSDVPLVIRQPRRLGQVVFVATDLDRGPIRDWSDRGLLVAKVLGLPTAEQAESEDQPVQSLRL